MSAQFSEQGADLPGSDFTVISSDGVHFNVHKKNMECASIVFGDMLGSSDKGCEVTLVEKANVLARVLPFAYPAQVCNIGISSKGDIYVVKAIIKYQVRLSEPC
ncbi:hypothetical protein RQP46_008651 [Phenoliferia psychrophenolica]